MRSGTIGATVLLTFITAAGARAQSCLGTSAFRGREAHVAAAYTDQVRTDMSDGSEL